MPRLAKVAALTALLLLLWSVIFAPTFRLPFFWDDFHLIRPYSGAEIRSAFHAVIDPDKIETPGLRPCSIFLYDFQGTLFGENIFAHRVFMIVLMGIFMVAAGMLLLEIGLGFSQLVVVFVLFVSSRVFASLVLWICLSHLIMAYIWIALTALFFVLWVKKGRWFFLLLMLVATILATFTREETYTLPVVLPLLWLISFSDRSHWRRVLTAALSILAIVCFHYWLWHFLVPNALSPEFGVSAVKRFLGATGAALLPVGSPKWIGSADNFIGYAWIIFLISIVLLFFRRANRESRWRFLGACWLGALLSLPAIGVARSFGIALPTLAFMTALSIAIAEIYNRLQSRDESFKWQRYAVLAIIIFGLAVGVAGGIRRSKCVAESVQENSAWRMVRDGKFLFDMFDHPTTIPEARREAGLARLRAFGIQSAADVRTLEKTLRQNRDQPGQSAPVPTGLTVSKYDYLSF
jgi:hypothetical protein